MRPERRNVLILVPRFDELGLRCDITSSDSRYVLFARRAPSPSSNLAAAAPPLTDLRETDGRP
ncbi:MAG: hypothetical protein WC674_08365 [Candidatus Krumholzibacteriia bacterium]